MTWLRGLTCIQGRLLTVWGIFEIYFPVKVCTSLTFIYIYILRDEGCILDTPHQLRALINRSTTLHISMFLNPINSMLWAIGKPYLMFQSFKTMYGRLHEMTFMLPIRKRKLFSQLIIRMGFYVALVYLWYHDDVFFHLHSYVGECLNLNFDKNLLWKWLVHAWIIFFIF